MRVSVVIDRFEGDKAVLLLGDEEVHTVWPRAFLPAGVREGDVLSFLVSVDNEATLSAREAADKLLMDLTKKGG